MEGNGQTCKQKFIFSLSFHFLILYTYFRDFTAPYVSVERLVWHPTLSCLHCDDRVKTRYLDLPERLELPERPPKYRKDQRIIGKY